MSSEQPAGRVLRRCPAAAGVLSAATLLLTACAGGTEALPRSDDRPASPPPASPSAPSPGAVDPAAATDLAQVRLPAAATGTTARLTRSTAGVDVYLLSFRVPDRDALAAFCRDGRIAGPFPRSSPPTPREQQGFGLPATAAVVATCASSLPGDYDVQRTVLAAAAPGGALDVRLVTFRMPR